MQRLYPEPKIHPPTVKTPKKKRQRLLNISRDTQSEAATALFSDESDYAESSNASYFEEQK